MGIHALSTCGLPFIITAMTATVESVVNQALRLSEDERSFDHGETISDEMKDTLDRRWDEIVSGKVKCRDAFEVLDEIRARLHIG